MKDEKYISIEHDRWEEYYKPLEEINKGLESKVRNLERTLAGNYINLYISNMWFPDASHGRLEKLGIVNIGIDPREGYSVKEFDKGKFLRYVQELSGVNISINNERQKQLLAAAEKVNKLPKFIKYLFNIKP